ncbi:MAG: outer membrane lipoprotein-sorting protein [Bacteroidetes bacterium]|nr:outer membrane lipoprotein-sorting protein [Bacteroidota bacterium]
MFRKLCRPLQRDTNMNLRMSATKKITLLISAIIVITASVLAFTNAEPTVNEIIQKAQDKMQGATTKGTLKITTIRPSYTRTMDLKMWSKGSAYALTLITSPVKDKGTVFLKRQKEVWTWIPTIEQLTKLPPSAMASNWMGTDLTNDDLVKESSMVDDYTHTLLGKDSIDGRQCYKIKSIPKENAAVVWGKLISWIDVKDFIQMKTEFYDEDEELVNTFKASVIKVMGGKTLASRLEIVPADKKGHKTRLDYLSLSFNEPIEDNFFTTQNMKKVN